MGARRLIAALTLVPLPALAGAAEDAARIEDCLGPPGQPGAQGAACIGVIERPCRAKPGGETTLGIVECLQREAAAWDVLLNRYYRRLRAELDEPARTSIRDAQRAWIAFRDADCAFAYDQFIGGSFRAVTGATCLRDRTAERASQLRDYLHWGD